MNLAYRYMEMFLQVKFMVSALKRPYGSIYQEISSTPGISPNGIIARRKAHASDKECTSSRILDRKVRKLLPQKHWLDPGFCSIRVSYLRADITFIPSELVTDVWAWYFFQYGPTTPDKSG